MPERAVGGSSPPVLTFYKLRITRLMIVAATKISDSTANTRSHHVPNRA
jgi:hypothetical protein